MKKPLKPEINDKEDKRCMSCLNWVMNGATILRDSDEIFVCFSCRYQIGEGLDQFVAELTKPVLDGKYELDLNEQDILILDAMLRSQPSHLSIIIQDGSGKQKLIIASDLIELKRKIGIFTAVLKSSHQLDKPVILPDNNDVEAYS